MRRNYFPIVLTSIALFASKEASLDAAPVWLAIGDENLQGALKPLIEHRAANGFDVKLQTPPVDQALGKLSQPPNYILLLGDDVLHGELKAGKLPGKRETLYRWQATQPETAVSDAIYGDLDNDGIPEVPVGRLPGRSPKEIARAAAKIVAFERLPTTLDTLHVPVWAGNPAYGDSFHANMASNLLRQTVHREAPPWADLTLIMGNETDPLSAAPDRQVDLFHELLMRGGGLFTGLMGHGGTDAFYSMPQGNRWITYHRSKASQLMGRSPSAPAIIFACDCGNFAHPSNCLSESLFQAPNGPVAVISATTQSHPLPNYYSSVSWLQCVQEGEATIGDRWVATQRRGYRMKDLLVELFLKDVEGKLEVELNTPQIRKDHLRLYALIGDPATTLKRPKSLEATFTRDGDEWTWEISNPPKKAKSLSVGHRAPAPVLKPKPKGIPAAEAMEKFREANAALRFQDLESLEPVNQWSGRVAHRPGMLRIVVQTDSTIFVAAHPLKES